MERSILKKIFSVIGPGFITASVVLGPGSITVASQIGAKFGYSLLWVVPAAAAAMAAFTLISARFGALHQQTLLQAIADCYGRWFAVFIGVSCFLMATGFQFGNNLGVATAMHSLTGVDEEVWPPVFTGAAVVLVFFAKQLYRRLEMLMTIMVMTMIIAFFLNLIMAGPKLPLVAAGFVPSFPTEGLYEISALVATTFVLHVAFYQAYLTQKKGWGANDLQRGFRDTIAGIVMLALVTLMIIMTAATVLQPRGIHIVTAADMAVQLQILFGPFAKAIFSIGLWAAAFSSLAVNMVVGGGLLADGLGLGQSMDEPWPRRFAAVGMLIGMAIAMILLTVNRNIVSHLILAQASTLFAVPAVAVGLFLVANSRKIMGVAVNRASQNALAVFGMVLIFLMVYFRYVQLIKYVRN